MYILKIGDDYDGYTVIKLLDSAKVLGTFNVDGLEIDGAQDGIIDSIMIAVEGDVAKQIALLRNIGSFNITGVTSEISGEKIFNVSGDVLLRVWKAQILKAIKDIKAPEGSISIVEKKEYSFRSAKNDYVVVSDFKVGNENNDSLTKYNNLIAITDAKDEETISFLADKFNAKDVIYSLMQPEYISKRIIKYISQNME